MPEWLQSLHAIGQWLILGTIVLLLLPFERYFPRIANQNKRSGRMVSIAAMGLAAAFVSWVMHLFLQPNLVAFFLNLKVVSISKLPLDPVLIFVFSFLLLDFLGYVLHWASHRVTLLWRLHAVHHADEHITAASSFLHHPLGVLLSGVFMLFFAVILGIPILVFVIYGVCGAVHNAISHADITLPRRLERVMRWLFVTPDVHRSHHSIQMREGNSNFGIMFSIWDRLFNTYVDRPSTGDSMLVMGLPESEKPDTFTVSGLLLHPFVWRKRRRTQSLS